MFRSGSDKSGFFSRGDKTDKDMRKQVGQLMKIARQKHRKQDLPGETEALQEAAFLLHEHDQYKDAAEIWIEILKLYNNEKGRTAQAIMYSNLATSLRNADEIDQADRYYEKALAIHQDTKDIPGAIRDGFNLGMLAASRADYQRALQQLDAALVNAEQLGDREWIARIHRYIGELHFISCHFQQALESFDVYCTLGEKLEAIDWAIDGLCWMSQCYRWNGEYHYAIQALEDAFAAADASGDSKLQVMVMGHIGDLSLALGDVDRARDYALRARKICEVEAIPAASRILVNVVLAQGNADRGMTHKSRDHYEEALDLARQMRHLLLEAKVEHHFAALEFREARLKEAYARAGNALRLARSVKDPLTEGLVCMLMGRIAQRRGEEETAFEYRRRSLEIAREIGVDELLWQSHYNLGRLHQRIKNNREAEAHYRTAVDVLERLSSTIRINYYSEAFFRDKARMQLYQDLITLLVSMNKTEDARMYFDRVPSTELKNRLKHLVHLD